MLNPIASRLEQYLNLLSARQKLTASNIANADTPGYKTRDVDFETEFRNASSQASPSIREVEGLSTRNDGNNVSLDREARMLSENAMRFSVATHLLQNEIRGVRSAIGEGRNS